MSGPPCGSRRGGVHKAGMRPRYPLLGRNLEECAARYRAFCRGRRSAWAQQWLPDVRSTRSRPKPVPGQLVLWERCQVQNADSLPFEVVEVADRFTRANAAWP